MASNGLPYWALDRVLTSQITSTWRSAATMSISPSVHRQLRSRIRNPARSRYSTAACSPHRPRLFLAFTRTSPPPTTLPDGGGCPRGQLPRCGRPALAVDGRSRLSLALALMRGGTAAPGRPGGPMRLPRPRRARDPPRRRPLFGFGQFQVALGQFLDVDVLEGDDPYIFHKTGRTVHVPHPGILHRDLEEDLAVVGGADVQLDLIGQVEPSLGLHHVREELHYVPVLAIELQLHLGFVLLEVLRAHGHLLRQRRELRPR